MLAWWAPGRQAAAAAKVLQVRQSSHCEAPMLPLQVCICSLWLCGRMIACFALMACEGFVKQSSIHIC
jgi:hypothetical protein